MRRRPCDDGFIAHLLETQAIMSNSRDVFPYEAEVERDRDSAASVSEPCDRCGIAAELDSCPFCNRLYCEPCQEHHDCALTQIVDGIDARNQEYLEGKRNG